VSRYYQSGLGRYKPVSSEITGYAASTLVYLRRETGDDRYLDAGRRAATFLAACGWNAAAGAFPFEIDDSGGVSPAYFFDTGIIVRGLLAAGRVTRDETHCLTARQGAESMRDFLGDFDIHPVLDLPSKRPLPHGASWSRRPGCYQLKSAMAWHEVGEHSLYERALERALATEESFLPGDDSRERVMDRLHAYCYFLEGLLPALDKPECRRAMARGVRRAGELFDDISPVFVRSDVIAQLLRLRLLGDALGVLPLDEDAARAGIAALPGFQLSSPDPRIDGGFCFGRKCGADLPFVNPVSTAFAVQALSMWEQHKAGRFDPGHHHLI